MSQIPPIPPTPVASQAPMPSGMPQFVINVPEPAPAKLPSPGKRIIRYLLWCVFLLSIVINIYLLMALAMLSDGNGLDTKVLRKGQEDHIVAVYTVKGVIADEAAGQFDRFYRQVQDNDAVKVIVLRVDSPGGTVAASEQIHHRITQLRKAGKKVVVSMGGTAASGGYLISAPADAIYAEPSTITGSIGVIAQVPNLQGTLDKIGMKMLVFKSSHAEAWKDQLSPFRKPAEREKVRLIEILDAMQTQFEDVVREGRRTAGGKEKIVTKEETIEITVGEGKQAKTKSITTQAPFNGKIYLADEAKEFGLIDEIGFLEDAIDHAITLSGVEKPTVQTYKIPKGLMELFSASAKANSLQIDPALLDRLQTPRVLMLWRME